MKEYTILETKEQLLEALKNNIITTKEHDAVLNLLISGLISPDEVCEGFLASKKSENRHK